jgi:hypothetical protein
VRFLSLTSTAEAASHELLVCASPGVPGWFVPVLIRSTVRVYANRYRLEDLLIRIPLLTASTGSLLRMSTLPHKAQGSIFSSGAISDALA